MALRPLCNACTAAFFLLTTGCAVPEQDKVVESWPSGAPKEIHVELGEGKGKEIKRFHENGRIHLRGSMMDGHREGTWNTYREDGLPWSQVTYSAGVKEGPFRTWHTTGVPHVEGQHVGGKPVGTWRFYGDDGQLLETKVYPAPN